VRPINLPDLSGLTLLVVEDDDDSLDLLRNVLNAYGAHVLEARTGIGALAYVNTTPKIDVLLTDLSMPTMDGIRTAVQDPRTSNAQLATRHCLDRLLRKSTPAPTRLGSTRC